MGVAPISGSASGSTPPSFAVMHRAVRARLDELTREIIEELQRVIPAYADVAAGDLIEGVAGDIARAIDAVASGRASTPEELEACEAVGEQRAEQGVPVEALIQAFQVAAERTLTYALAAGEQAGAEPRELLSFSRIGWAWANEAMTRAAQAHRRTELELVRRDVHQRDELLRALVLGTVPASESRLRLPVYGIRPSAPHCLVRARPLRGTAVAPAEVVGRLRRAHHAGGLVGMVDGDVVVVSARPATIPDGYCAGVGGPAALDDLPVQFADASRALDAAWSFDLPGAHRLEDVGLLASVILDQRVGDLLRRRLIDALGSEQEQERMCVTLEALFAHELRVPEAARALHVHENTVRKRLRALEERTGASLRRMDDLVALWWALRHRRARAAVSETTPRG